MHFLQPIVESIAQGFDLWDTQHSRLHPRDVDRPFDLIDDALNKMNLQQSKFFSQCLNVVKIELHFQEQLNDYLASGYN